MSSNDGTYLPRIADQVLERLMTGLPAIALQGAKGVGKTATGRRHADHRLDFDDPATLEAYTARAIPLADIGDTILIDEWQLIPQAWNDVRRAVDDGAAPGRFLLAGSSAPPSATIHSGAGRIHPLRMRPLSLAERQLEQPTVSLTDLFSGQTAIEGRAAMMLTDYVDEILATGLPGIRSTPASVRSERIDGYLEWLVQKEFAEQGIVVRRPATLREWLRAYAAATGTTAAYTRITEAATPALPQKPATQTTMVYRDTLARAFLLDPLDPWATNLNHMSRMASSPKHFLADPGLAARLLGATKNSLLRGRASGPVIPRDGTLLGGLFEHLVTMSVLTYAQPLGARVTHLRQQDGRHEIDILVEKDNEYVAIEVKLAPTIKDDDVKHLHWLKSQLDDAIVDTIVVTTGPFAYRRDDGIAVVPAALLGP